MPPLRRFYGWPLVAVAWVLYGFGVAPAFYSWGFFLPELIAELGISRTQSGQIFGVYAFVGAAVAPLVGWTLGRFGIRWMITAGSLAAAVGFWLTSRADSVLGLYLSFAIVTAATHAFATLLPAQTLASNWFLKNRALAMGIILTAGGIVGPLWLQLDAWLLEHYSWRTGWVLISGLSVVLAGIAALLVRDRPEDLGQLQDGAASEDEVRRTAAKLGAEHGGGWTASEAMRTPQFYLMVLCGLGYAMPWFVLNAHGRLHLQDLGMSTQVAAAILGSMVLVSTLGRLGGFIADRIRPTKALGIALVVEAAGCAILLVARTPPLAYTAVIAIGLGFGLSYISIAAAFSSFFGRKAFATTTGTRFLIGGVFNAITPALAGMAYERTGSYALAFIGLVAIGIVGATVAFTLRPPQRGAVAPAVVAASGAGPG
ncbi:MAG TPA: MFS transporter [Thermoanaerobaculia bacterium]|nr:MFS transporter [Thermoanaerobaculia bacterium]